MTFHPACHSEILCLELPNSPPQSSSLPVESIRSRPSPLSKLDSSVSCFLRPNLAKCNCSSLCSLASPLRHESGRAERTVDHAAPNVGPTDGGTIPASRANKFCAILAAAAERGLPQLCSRFHSLDRNCSTVTKREKNTFKDLKSESGGKIREKSWGRLLQTAFSSFFELPKKDQKSRADVEQHFLLGGHDATRVTAPAGE